MTIHLPDEVKRDILAEVQSGHFASVDDAIAEAWKSFRRLHQTPAPSAGMGFIGALREDAAILDQAVEHAMKMREEQPWRIEPGE